MDFSSRQSKLARNMAGQKLDAVVVTHLPNIRYLCGFTGSSGVLVVTATSGRKKAVFFTDGRYTQQAREQVKGAKVTISNSAAIMSAAGWLAEQQKCLSVGFEADHMTVNVLATFKATVGPRARLRPISGLIEGQRAIKDAAEIRQIKAAVCLASSVFEAVQPDIKPGMTEAGLAAEIEYLSRRMGAEGMSFDTLVAGGKRSALPHGVASQARLPERGFVILDFGVILGGYCSDMTRTVYLGKPDKASRVMYEAVLEAQLAGIRAVTPRAKCAEVDYQTRKVLEKAGLARYFTHSTGHGVGLEIHEMPGLRKGRISPKTSKKGPKRPRSAAGTQFDTLQPGMVVTIEPGVYIPGQGGVRIEDMVLVTESGCEVLTPTRKDLIVI